MTLGHAMADVTQVYAERDLNLARRIAPPVARVDRPWAKGHSLYGCHGDARLDGCAVQVNPTSQPGRHETGVLVLLAELALAPMCCLAALWAVAIGWSSRGRIVLILLALINAAPILAVFILLILG